METHELLYQREMASLTWFPRRSLQFPRRKSRGQGEMRWFRLTYTHYFYKTIHRDPLHSTRNPPQHSVMTYMGREPE